MAKTFFIILTFILSIPLCAQDRSRTVTFLDQEGNAMVGIPIVFENVLGKTQYSTNENGEIQLTDSLPYKLYLQSIEIGSFAINNPKISEREISKTIVINSNLQRINPVSITGNIQPKLATANPYSVTIISKTTIQNMGAQNLGEVLQNQSGVQLNQDPSLGTTMQLQGLGGQNVKILINGVPMIGRLNGNIDVSQILANNIERIEIIEGPMSVVYGTDAIGGIINVITKRPLKNQLSSNLKYFSDWVGNQNVDAGVMHGFSHQSKKKFNHHYGYNLDFGRYFFDGMDFNTDTRSLDWKPKTKLFANLGLNYANKFIKQSNTGSIFLERLTDRSDAEFNLVSVTGYNNYFNTIRADFTSTTEITLSKNASLQFQNSHNIYYRTKSMVRRNLVTGIETVTRPEDQDTTLNTQINLRGLFQYTPKSVLSDILIGYEYQNEDIQTQRILKDGRIQDFALFGSVEYIGIRKLQIKPSLRIAYNNRFGRNPMPGVLGNNLKLAPIVPSIQLKYQISKHLFFRASYAKGFRAPTAKELYFLFVDLNHNVQGNENLSAEIADNFNASIDYRHQINTKSAATFKVSGFSNFIKNQIQLSLLDINTNLYQYINIGEMHSTGSSASTNLVWKQWNIGLGGAYILNHSKTSPEESLSSWNLVQSNMNIEYVVQTLNFSVQFFSRYTGETKGFLSSGSFYTISPYYLSDLSFIKTLYNKHLKIQLGCKNLFNVTTLTASGTTSGGIHGGGNSGVNIAPGRNIFINLTLTL